MAPEWIDDVRFLFEALDRIRVSPRVLKVIPQHLLATPELVHLLRQEQENGSEIVLHGYAHHSGDRWHGPWPRRLRARLFARHDAEFLSLPPGEMEARLVNGREILHRAGLSAAGFCAPGWLATSDLLPVLRGLGFRYDVRMTHLIDLKSQRRLWTDWIGYMGAGTVQERLVGIANRLNRLGARAFPVLKVFLHPQGARRSAACRRVLEQIPELMRERTLATYGQLVAE